MWGQETVTLWSEDFSSFSANDVPSGGTYSYVCTDGGTTTKIYNENLAGGTAPELLVSKTNGTFTATVPLNNIEGDLTLKFYTNKQTISVSTSTEGISGSLTEKAEGEHTLTFTGVTASMTQIVIEFKGSGSSNVRLDNIVLTGTKASTSGPYTVTYDANGATSGSVPTDNTQYTATNNTVTVKGNTGNLAKEHFSFDGWNTKADGTGTGYVAGNTFTISANTTLYAQWAGNTHNVTLPAEDTYGTYSMSATNPVAYGTEVTLTYTPAAGYENYAATWSVNGTAISEDIFTMPDEDVTVTVDLAAVADYATLPFNWGGGPKADLLAEQGVTANGLGSDYDSNNHSPYLIKFDGTGDYIQIKTDSQPGKVIVGVKMVGGGSTSTITVQGSSDGVTFTNVEELTISGTQNTVLILESVKAFGVNDRYVRLLFTKGSNVGVGPITIAKPSTDPEIVANATVELAADATSGEIEYTINNAVPGTSLTASTTATWISEVTVASDKVTFTTTANEGAERTATIVLTYGEFATKEITIKQAAYVAPLTAVTDKMWTFEEWEDGDITTTTVIDNLEVNASNDKKITIDGNNKSIDGYTFTKRLKLGGIGSTTERNVHFKIAGSSKITVYGMSGKSGSERTIEINIGNEAVASLVNDGNAIGKVEYTYTGEETDVFVYSANSGNNIYGIKVEPYDDTAPIITVENTEVSVVAEETEDEIEVTYQNFTEVVADVQFYEADGTTEATYDWIDAEINNDNNVYYTVSANTGNERTAYLKVYALVDNSYVYSDLITITQAKYVAPFEGNTYSLASSITPGKHYILVSEVVDLDGTAYAMGEQKSNNRNAVEITVVDNKAQVSSTDVREFVISIPEDDGFYAIYDELEPGYLYAASSSSNHLKTQADLTDNGKWKITFGDGGVASIVAQGTNTRNVMQYNSGSTLFACYASASQSPVYLYEKVEDKTTVVTISALEYATFGSSEAVDFSGTTLKVYTAKVNDTNTEVVLTEVPSKKVPAGEAVLLHGTAGTYTGTVIDVIEQTDEFTNNELKLATQDLQGNGNIYVLNKVDDKVGFYKLNGTLSAGKAYLEISGSGAPMLAITGNEGTTGIVNVNRETITNNQYYTLDGRRVENPSNGIYIVNGKKVVIK